MGSPKTLSHLTLGDIEISKSRSLRFWSIISRKGAMLIHMLLFNINRKAYVGSPFVHAITFDLSDLHRSESRSLRFRSIISGKGAELGQMLLLNINMKVRRGVHWCNCICKIYNFRELERSLSRSLRFQRLISCKGAELGHVLLLDINHIWSVQQNHDISIWVTL